MNTYEARLITNGITFHKTIKVNNILEANSNLVKDGYHGFSISPVANTPKTIKTVYIPACVEHDGISGTCVKLYWNCPVCGQPRGEIMNDVRSYDGSRILYCDGWRNPCGHNDKYSAVRNEARNNGLNQ